MFLRTILNTAHRMVYPFLSIFARGLGVDISTMSLLMTARSLLGATSPLFAPIADRRGRKFGMLTGIVIFILGVGTVAIYPSFWTLAIALILAMVGKYLFDPSMQAYFGDRIPYEQRGTALAITEVAWSMAFIVGVPAMGFLINKFGCPHLSLYWLFWVWVFLSCFGVCFRTKTSTMNLQQIHAQDIVPSLLPSRQWLEFRSLYGQALETSWSM